IQHNVGVMPFGEWLLNLAQVSAYGLIVALPIMLAVVATFNRAPATPWRRYPALVLALILSSAAGSAVLMAAESGWTFEFRRTDIQISSLMLLCGVLLRYFML